MKRITVRWHVLAAVLLLSFALASSLAVQTLKTNVAPVRVCVVQAKYGDDFAQINGTDAGRIATELSTLSLKNGTPVKGIAIARMGSDRVDELVERAQCLYRVDVDRHVPAGRPSSIANMPDDMPLPPEPQIASMIDKPLIMFRVRLANSRKALYSGTELPPTFHGRSARASDPYPAIGARIVKTLNH